MMDKRLWIRHLSVNFALLCGTLFVCLLFLEMALRLGWVPNDKQQRQRVQGVGEIKEKILFVGDSFIALNHAGIHLNKAIVEELSGKGIGIVNVAQANTGPIEYLVQLKTTIRKHEFKSVYLFYYVGNDIWDTLSRIRLEKNKPLFYKIKRKVRPWIHSIYSYKYYTEQKNRFLNFSHLMLLDQNYSKFLENFDPDHELYEDILNRKIDLKWAKLIKDNKEPYVINYNILMEDTESKSAWERIKQTLREMKSVSEMNGAKLHVVIFPSDSQLDKRKLEYYRALNFEVDPSLLGNFKAQKLLNDFCRQENLDCLDLAPFFLEHKDKNIHQRFDDHLGVEGNRLVGKFVAKYILGTYLDPSGTVTPQKKSSPHPS